MRAVVLLGLLTVGFYWKLTLGRQFTHADSPDLAYMVLPWYQFQARAWHSGVFPLWDPYQWCGQPLLAQMQPGAAFPLNWPLFLAPLRDGRLNLDLFHWHYVLMHWLAAIFMYAYCRELERSRFASILAGSAFSFGGFLGSTTWPQVVNGALWMPLIFLLYHRAGRAKTSISTTANAAGCGASIGMALLAGQHEAPMLAILTLTAVFLFQLLSRSDRLRRIRLFATAGVFAALVAAFVLLPGWEYGSRSYRWVSLASPVRLHEKLPYIAYQDFALKPVELLGLLAPIEEGTAHPFVGLVSFALALFGVAACWTKSAVKLHACVTLGGLAYTLGSHSPFQGVLYALIPFVDKARSPSKAALVFHFGLLLVAAHGADALFLPIGAQKRLIRALLAGAAALGGASLLLKLGAAPAPSRIPPTLLAAVVALVLAGLAYAASRGKLSRRSAGLGVILLLLLELNAATVTLLLPRSNPQKPNYLDQLAQHPGVVDFLKAQPRPFRFHKDDQEIAHNLGDWEGLEATEGYVATVNADVYDLFGLDWTRAPLLLNQIYWVGKRESRPEQIEVFSEPGGLKVFQNPDALPRVWMVRSVRQAADLAEARNLLGSSNFDPRRETFLVGPKVKPPAWEPCEGDARVEIVSQELHRVAARVETRCSGMLVFADPIFPGWKARVDGSPATLYAAYSALRGVVVSPGEHSVEFLYRPSSVYVGAALSAVGLAGCLILAVAASRKSRRSGVPGDL